uniref:Uncharacterized protein n=1 Tax=Romanomermis culicivorax TaxID=13658 RepID=A0A915HT68_ROMCU
MAFAKISPIIAADRWHLCQMSPPLIKQEAIVTFAQELGRLPLNGYEEEREKSEEEAEISGNDLFVSLKSKEQKEKVFYTLKLILKEAVKYTFSLINKKDKQSGVKSPPNLLQGKSLPTSSTESIKRMREEKSSTKSSESPPKKSKVGAEINPTQASRRVMEESRTPVQIAFGTPTVFKSKPPPPDCHFSAFNYFHRPFDTPVNNREGIHSRAQAEREAYHHLDNNLAAFIVCFMPPYHSEMPPTAREFAELRSVHLRNQL